MGFLSRLTLSLLLLSGACFAQLPFGIGLKAGVPITDAFSSTTFPSGASAFSDSKNYIIGPTVELRLPFHLSVEADALYRPLNITTTAISSFNGTTIIDKSSSDYSSWEFPILAKYHFGSHFLRPYVEIGPSFRTTASAINYLSNNGVTFGAGAEVKALLLRVSPEFRYTHWSSDSTVTNFIPVGSKQDQVEFLVGFSF